MMKKALIMTAVMAVTLTSAAYAGCPVKGDSTPVKCPRECSKIEKNFSPEKRAEMEKRRAEFETRLNLTDEQKEQAKAIREKGHEQMKPLIEKMKEKKAEAKAVKLSKITPEEQEAKLKSLREQKMALKKEMGEIRKANQKEFEAILTKKQQQELVKMKKEGRKEFEKKHKEFKKDFAGGERPVPPCKKPCPTDCDSKKGK